MAPADDTLARRAATASIMVCLAFAAFTHHAWEDYLITFRASLNLATGHGLVFQPGERVHSFTSPLGTLLPALFALGGGPGVELRALWLFRCASAAALGTAIFLAARIFARDRLAPWAAAVGCGLWLCDPKIVDFSINGMESAFVVLFVVITWRAFATGARLWPVALGLAGLQWTRPDGCVLFGALGLAWWAFGAGPDAGPDRRPVTTLVRTTALGLALYLPWVLWAWSYYGSPIPNTILAKASHPALAEVAARLALYPVRLLAGHVQLHDIFMPAYFYFGGWPPGLAWFSRLLVVGAALTWAWPRVPAAGRVASAALLLGGFYVEIIPGSPWYFPGWQVLACVAWAYLLHTAAGALAPAGPARSTCLRLLRIGGGTLVAVQLALLTAVAWQMRNQQELVERTHRREIGLWLKQQAAPHDSVYLEPLGYIGYYSGLKMLDNPGLCAPEVVAVRRSGRLGHAQIIAALRPEWLVLRPDQVLSINTADARLLPHDYRLARVFDARARINAVAVLPGRDYLAFDGEFLVYHRVASAPGSHGP